MFQYFQGEDEGYVCGECHLLCEQSVKQKHVPFTEKRKQCSPFKTPQTHKRPNLRSTPQTRTGTARIRLFGTPKRDKHTTTHTRRKLGVKLQSVIAAIQRSDYPAAFKHLIGKSKAAEKGFHTVVALQVRNELRKYRKLNDVFPQFNGQESLDTFSWDQLLNSMKSHMPTMNAAIAGSMPREGRIDDNKFRFVKFIFAHKIT